MNLHRNCRRALASTIVLAAAAWLNVAAAQTQQNTQQSGTTTRAAQKADLKKLEQNGYQPGTDDPHYPQNIQNAEKKAYGGSTASAPSATQ